MRLFLDSSAFAKRYIAEPGSDRVAARCAEADQALLSVIALPEAMSTLNRLRREGKLSDDGYLALKQDIVADLGQATIIDLTPSVVARAVVCLERSPLRALDAIHVASAMECSPDLFLSADRRQCQAARGMGLKVEEVAS